jgi:hypothetical protein
MSQPAQEEARAALHNAVDSYGVRVLSNSSMLSNLLTDLLPDAPLERNILVAAANAGTAVMLQQYIAEQHMEPGAAVRLAASALAARTGIDPAKCAWAAAEYAQVLGHAVSTPSGPLPPPPMPMPPPMPPSAPAPMPSPTAPPSASVPDPRWPGIDLSSPYPAPMPMPASVPGQTPPRPTRRGPIFALIAAVAVLVLAVGYLTVAGAVKLPPFGASATRSPVVTPTPASSKPSPTSTIKLLRQLLPADAIANSCTDKTSDNNNPGIQLELVCDTGDGVQLEAEQFDTPGHYLSGLTTITTNVKFDEAQAQGCPPADNTAQGQWLWYSSTDPAFPARSGQVLDCFYYQQRYYYTYTMPTQNAIIEASTSDSWTTLDNWWNHFVGNAPVSSSPTAN